MLYESIEERERWTEKKEQRGCFHQDEKKLFEKVRWFKDDWELKEPRKLKNREKDNKKKRIQTVVFIFFTEGSVL